MKTRKATDNDSSSSLSSSSTTTTEIKFACLTNACVAYAHAVLKVNSIVGDINDTSLYDKFLSIHGADTVPAPKPEPDGLYQICKELNVSPANAVYIGDSPTDALAADAAGMPSIGVTWGSHSEESVRNSRFTYVATTVDELEALLNSYK
jgi:beta-phosphoglucomutase-like phosphatase (HAD superfamily)